jgi:hypothetical protein
VDVTEFIKFSSTKNPDEPWQIKEAWNTISRTDFRAVPNGADPGAPQLTRALYLRSIAAEIADYFGHYERAREFIEVAGKESLKHLRTIFEEASLGTNWSQVEIDRDLVLQQIWCVLQFGLCEYRAGNYDEASGMFQLCERIASSGLLGERMGTRARSLYSLGLVYREQYDLREAIRCFKESAELAYKSFRPKTGSDREKIAENAHKSFRPKASSDREASSQLARIAIARSTGMGLASVLRIQGRPDQAIPLLLTAKAMLPPNEKLISTHLDLVWASLPPWHYARSSGNEPGRANSAHDSAATQVKAIEACYEVFKDAGHRLYETRAAYYLVSWMIRAADEAYFKTRNELAYGADLDAAEKQLSDSNLLNSGDERFDLLGLALASGIARRRRDYERSENLASYGFHRTSPGHFPAVHIELLMARGMARIDRKKYAAAIEDFNSGLNLATHARNDWYRALFLLRLTAAYAQQSFYREATQRFTEYEMLKRDAEVEWTDVSACEDEARQLLQLGEANDYYRILRLQPEVQPDNEVRKLRQAMARLAKDRHKTDAEAAESLGISRQTLYNWES